MARKDKAGLWELQNLLSNTISNILLHQHPDSTKKNAFIFISREPSANYRNTPISAEALRADYIAFRKKIIPKLLKRPDLPESDKKRLELLKDQKKWNPYTMRHSPITKLARHANINDFNLRQHAGWSKRSDMVEVYTHELKGDSLEHVMMAYGINIKDKRDKSAQQLRKELVGPHCPFCHTVNIPDSQLCSSCYKPPTSVSYNKIMQEAEESKKKLQEIASLQEKQQAALEVMSVWANRMDVMSKQLEQAKAEIPRLSKNRR